MQFCETDMFVYAIAFFQTRKKRKKENGKDKRPKSENDVFLSRIAHKHTYILRYVFSSSKQKETKQPKKICEL